MQIKYKKAKVTMPHCGDCNELLSGNGSTALPYKCKCGTWRFIWLAGGNYEYELIPNFDIKKKPAA